MGKEGGTRPGVPKKPLLFWGEEERRRATGVVIPDRSPKSEARDDETDELYEWSKATNLFLIGFSLALGQIIQFLSQLTLTAPFTKGSLIS